MKNFVATLRRSLLVKVLVLVPLTPGLILLPVQVRANPTDGVVVIGDVNFQGMGTANLDINNLSQQAVIDWQSFSIAAGEVTNINQAANAHTLNRVISSSPTEIYGMLRAANGGVTVINSNGILVGEGGVVDIAGLMTMSTLDISNDDFLNGGANNYKGDSLAGIRNYGSISSQNGDVVLLGNFLQNAGSVSAPDGTVAFGAGGDMIVDQAGGGLISVRGGSEGGETGIENTGSVNAAGVELKAHGNVYALAIKNDGLVRASGYNFKGGRLTLSAGSQGSIVNTGQLQARNRDGSGGRVEISGGAVALSAGAVDAAGETGQVGGSVAVTGSEVTVGAAAQVTAAGSTGGSVRLSSTGNTAVNGQVVATGAFGSGGAVVVEGQDISVGSEAVADVSGETGGGSLKIGGGFQGSDAEVANATTVVIDDGALLRGDAKSSGTGGSVIVWSDGDTLFRGEISATGINGGGFVEVSGRERLGFDGVVSTTSADGRTGVLLLDPTDGTVSTGAQNLAGNPFNINSTTLGTSLATNNVVISTPAANASRGTVTFNNAVTWNSANSLSVLAHGDVVFNANVQNGGSGSLNIVAGWNGTTGLPASSPLQNPGTVTFADFLADPTTYGNAQGGINGSVLIGSGAQTVGIAVGSRSGQTNVAGFDVRLTGAATGTVTNGYAQLGYRLVNANPAATGATGAIVVAAKNDVIGTAGNLAGNTVVGAYVQIGHGARNTTAPGAAVGSNFSGDITINAVQDVSFSGGTSVDTYALIGHGGLQAQGTHSGVITVNALRDVKLTASTVGGSNANGYAKIGHGGFGGAAGTLSSTSGNITVSAGQDVLVSGGSRHSNRFAQIGNGGRSINGNHSGNLSVVANRNIAFTGQAGPAATAPGSFVQLGNGGFGSSGNHSGTISVRAGAGGVSGTLTFTAGGTTTDRYAQLGHGGRLARGNHSGTIEVLALDTVAFVAGTNERNYAQLGHGGHDAEALVDSTGNTGDIRVGSENGSIEFRWAAANTATNLESYAQLGHGGLGTSGNHAGDISTRAGQAVLFRSSTNTTDVRDPLADPPQVLMNYVQLGHGGGGSVTAGFASGNHSGAITVSAGSTITFTAGVLEDRYAQLGHGGKDAAGNHSGAISVLADGDLRFSSGAGSIRGYNQLGHGGHNADSTTGHTGAIGVASRTGNIFFSGSNAASTEAYTQLGHGGYDAAGAHNGNIVARAGNQVLFDAGLGTDTDPAITGVSSYAQLGHGGLKAAASTDAVANLSGTIAVSGQIAGDFTDIGDFDGDTIMDTVTLVAGAGTAQVRFRGGVHGSTDHYAQLGHGGGRNQGNHSGNIDVESGGIVSFTSATSTGVSAGANAYKQLGHGGIQARGDHSGTIDVTALGNITFTGSSGVQSYSQLGHGGFDADNPNPAYYPDNVAGGTRGPTAAERIGNSGAITVESTNGNLVLTAGSQTNAYAHLGHGGAGTDGDHVGNITVLVDIDKSAAGTGGNVTLAPGSTTSTTTGRYTQIGHGGFEASGGHTGNLIVEAGAAITMTGGGAENYTQIGHGGRNDHRVNRGGSAAAGYTQNNGNDRYYPGTHSGSITVTGGGDIQVRAGSGGGSYGQIGHGGFRNAAQSGEGHNGAISVTSAGLVSFISQVTGGGSQAYLQIGHGGYQAFGNHGYQVVRAQSGVSVGVGPAVPLGNTSVAPGSVRITVGTGVFTDDGIGGLIDTANVLNLGANFQVGTINYTTGELTFTTDANPGASAVAVAYLHGGSDILVDGGSGVTFNGGRGDQAYAQIGHGGYDSAFSTARNIRPEEPTAPAVNTSDTTFHLNTPTGKPVGTSGNVTVRAGINGAGVITNADAKITFTTGSGETNLGDDAYAQIGNGGRLARGDHRGTIDVTGSGDITFTSFAGGESTQSQTSTTLNTRLTAGGNFTIGQTANLIRNETFTITYNNPLPGFSGIITGNAAGSGPLIDSVSGVQVGTISAAGVIAITTPVSSGTPAGRVTFDHFNTGLRTYAQIGHGGHDADNPNPTYYPNNTAGGTRGPTAAERVGNRGEISVESANGSLVFTSGSRTGSYTQIGHGGNVTDGDHVGDITVLVDIDQSAAGTGGNVTFGPSTRSVSGSYTQIGHGGFEASGGHTGNLIVEAGAAISMTSGGTENYTQIGHGGRNDHRVTRTGSSGNFTQTNNNDRYYPGTHSGTITVTGGGNIQLLAGLAGASYGQIGHGGFRNSAAAVEGHHGAISVTSAGSITGTGGGTTATSGTAAYVQIGHGGFEAFGNHGYQVVKAESVSVVDGTPFLLGNTSVAPGSVRLTLGTGVFRDNGLGGLIDTGGVAGAAGAQVGTVNYTTGELTFTPSFAAFTSTVAAAYLHGGSDILVDAGTGITFSGGVGDQSYAQIGHGGHLAAFVATLNIDPEEAAPAVINASNVTYHLNTPIGSPIGTSGAVTVRAGNETNPTAPIRFRAGSGDDTYVQIGNGGRAARANHLGDISVTATGDIEFSSYLLGSVDPPRPTQTSATLDTVVVNGSGTYAISQTANLVRDTTFQITYANPRDGFSGLITGDATGSGALIDSVSGVRVGTIAGDGDIIMTRSVSSGTPAASVTYSHFNTNLRTYARIGNGGHDANPATATPGITGNRGDIEVISTSGVIAFNGGTRPDGYAQIGHGGISTPGTHSGSINVQAIGAAGDIIFKAGGQSNTYAQLGHGGQGSTGSISGEITVATGSDVRFAGGAGARAYAQLGHGGDAASGTKGAAGDLLTDRSGDITVNADGIVEFIGGIHSTASYAVGAYAQLGHGGTAAPGTHQGNLVVNGGSGLITGTVADTAGLAFIGGGGVNAYSLLGHGGSGSPAAVGGVLAGTITVDSVDDIVLLAGTGTADTHDVGQDGRNFAKIGHGGFNSGVNNNIYAGGLGHTGVITVTSQSGDIFVVGGALANRSLGAGLGRYHFAQIGHGGIGSPGDHGGNILVVSNNGDVNLIGGDTTDTEDDKLNYAVIGHGSPTVGGNTGEADQTIKVYAFGTTSDINLQGGAGTGSAAQIGNGAFAEQGVHRGDIKLIAVNDLNMGSLGTTNDNYSKIGHGDRVTAGASRIGDIEISIGDSAVLDRALIGHQDFNPLTGGGPFVSLEGDTFIAVSRNNPLVGGLGQLITTSNTRISSGGNGSQGDELRLYMPEGLSNLIADDTYLNATPYTRSPDPGDDRSDEQYFDEHAFTAPVTEADAVFTPVGNYPIAPENSFGNYNIYYSFVPPVPPGTDFFGYDFYDRDTGFFDYDGYDEMLLSMALADGMEDDTNPSTGVWIIEELADGSFGIRRDGRQTINGKVIEAETDEEQERRRKRAARKVGRQGISYYVFDPATNKYSSYRVFGVPQTALSVTQ